MTLSSDPTTESLLLEFRSSLKSEPAQAAWDAFVEHARNDTRFQFVPRSQGELERTVRYMLGDAWIYGFIVNRADLLFYFRRPSGRVGDDVLEELRSQGLVTERNRKGELKVRVRDANEARLVIADCFENPSLTNALQADASSKVGEAPERADWSDDELRASVVAYRKMQELQRQGERRFKTQMYRDLATEFGRTDKAFEFRMQNISSVLAILGRDWLPGLKPAAHVGPNVAAKLEKLINELDGFEAPPKVEFEISVREQAKRQPSAAPVGQAAPGRTTAPVTSFVRDSAVKAWVLARAKGACECCRSPSPFVTPDGTPFLEVHHLRTLADGGSDRPSNATALCPNCHRHMHYGKDAALMRATVIEYVDELQAE